LCFQSPIFFKETDPVLHRYLRFFVGLLLVQGSMAQVIDAGQLDVGKFMFKCSVKLCLHDATTASACVLYHRFFQQCSLQEYDSYTVAATALYLATKVEEQHTRLRDIVNVCHHTRHPDLKHLELNRHFWDLRDTIASCELLMLRVLQFDVTYIHPHKYMLHYLMSLSQLFSRRVWETHPVADVAWAILKDSYLSSNCLDPSPQVYALAVIDLALQCCRLEVPMSRKAENAWWKALYDQCTHNDLVEVQNNLVAVYKMNTTISGK